MKENFFPHFPLLMKTLVWKGGFKILVLKVLQERPMHGYEISRVIRESSHGMYRPSPGAVYPALQTLLRSRLVKVSVRERRKIYQITPAGKRLLKNRHDEVHKIIDSIRKSMGPEHVLVMDEMAKTGKILEIACKTITPEQAKEIAKIMNKSREQILKILAE